METKTEAPKKIKMRVLPCCSAHDDNGSVVNEGDVFETVNPDAYAGRAQAAELPWPPVGKVTEIDGRPVKEDAGAKPVRTRSSGAESNPE